MITALTWLALASVAQSADTTPRHTVVAGAVSVTTKGISLLPALTLGKPAAIFDIAIRDGPVSFEPQLRFGLDGKPWTFIFWGRYRPLRGEKLQLTIGAHPAFTFRTIADSTNGVPSNVITTARYLAVEVSPSYSLTRDLSAGVYYLHTHGLDRYAVQNTNFVSARANFTNAPIAGDYFVQFAPQVYYLIMDEQDGVYVNVVLTLANRRLPLSISTLVNTPIETRIAAPEDFLWNVTVSYAMR